MRIAAAARETSEWREVGRIRLPRPAAEALRSAARAVRMWQSACPNRWTFPARRATASSIRIKSAVQSTSELPAAMPAPVRRQSAQASAAVNKHCKKTAAVDPKTAVRFFR